MDSPDRERELRWVDLRLAKLKDSGLSLVASFDGRSSVGLLVYQPEYDMIGKLTATASASSRTWPIRVPGSAARSSAWRSSPPPAALSRPGSTALPARPRNAADP